MAAVWFATFLEKALVSRVNPAKAHPDDVDSLLLPEYVSELEKSSSWRRF
jgi:hypothetical protein